MVNKFELYLKELSELKAVIIKLRFPERKSQNGLQFYDYLALKEVFIKRHSGDPNIIKKFEENVKNNNLHFYDLTKNNIRMKKYEVKESLKEYSHKCKDRMIFRGKKIIL